jgi:hypothetical protein
MDQLEKLNMKYLKLNQSVLKHKDKFVFKNYTLCTENHLFFKSYTYPPLDSFDFIMAKILFKYLKNNIKIIWD